MISYPNAMIGLSCTVVCFFLLFSNALAAISNEEFHHISTSTNLCPKTEHLKNICVQLMRTVGSSAVLKSVEDVKRTAICDKYTVNLPDNIGTLTSITNRKVGICFLGAGITKCVTKSVQENTIIVFTYNRISDSNKYCDNPMPDTFNFPASGGIFSWLFSCFSHNEPFRTKKYPGICSKTMDVSSCQKDRVIQTFPWIFVVIFFFFGFTSSLIGCLLINHHSNLKFIPFLAAILFEIILASFVSLLKSYHLQYLRSELFDSVRCYDSVAQHPQPTEDVEVDFDELNLKSMNYIQTTFNCCGVNSHEDWVQQHRAIPKSCCEHMKVCTLATVKEKIGCYEAVKMDVFSNWNAMIMFILIFICIKLIMLIMYKCSQISRSPAIETVSGKDEIEKTIHATTTKKRDVTSL